MADKRAEQCGTQRPGVGLDTATGAKGDGMATPAAPGGAAQRPAQLAEAGPNTKSAPGEPKPPSAPLIPPGKIAVYLMAYRRQPCRPQQDWIDALRARGPSASPGQGYLIRYGSEEYGIDLARNQNCRRFLAEDVPAGREYILMIDADIVPLPRRSPQRGEAGVRCTTPGQAGPPSADSEGILHDNGPLVYCGYSGHDATKGHFGDGDFGCGLCRIHRSVLEKMERPFFRMIHQDDRRVVCECSHFRRGAEKAGFKAVMVGVAGHEMTVVSIPKSKTEATIVFKNRLPKLRG